MDGTSGNPAGHPEQVAPQNNTSMAMEVEKPAFTGIPGLEPVSSEAFTAASAQNGWYSFLAT